MTLTILQNAIKMYVEGEHGAGREVTVTQIAKAFDIDPSQVRTALRALAENKKAQKDFFKKYGLDDLFNFGD